MGLEERSCHSESTSSHAILHEVADFYGLSPRQRNLPSIAETEQSLLFICCSDGAIYCLMLRQNIFPLQGRICLFAVDETEQYFT